MRCLARGGGGTAPAVDQRREARQEDEDDVEHSKGTAGQQRRGAQEGREE